ncbi:hypothetical protein BDV97DRAFT_424393 [Delphinella strobiligena]|nr:hypothetical protein BDV97DRAFT_424393 [Delphinella strobiligena]
MAPSEDTDKDSLSIYDNPVLSDVKILFSGQTFYGHKAILCQRSKYFMKAITSGFEEAYTGEIDLNTDDDPDRVRNMLRHIYDLPHVMKGPSHNLLREYVDLFLVGDKYDVPSLRLLCSAYPKVHVNTCAFNSKSFCDALQECFSSVHVDDSIKRP